MCCNSIRWEIYKAYPWLGLAQVPSETDEFVAMARVAQMDGFHWVKVTYTGTVALQYRQRFHYILKKWLWKRERGDVGPASPPPCSPPLVIPAALLIVIMLDCCNFRAPHRQWFCGSCGSARFSCSPSTSYKDIRLHTNRLTGFHSHCQSRNLCLCVAGRLSECEWEDAQSELQREQPACLHVCSLFTPAWPFSGLTCLNVSQYWVALSPGGRWGSSEVTLISDLQACKTKGKKENSVTRLQKSVFPWTFALLASTACSAVLSLLAYRYISSAQLHTQAYCQPTTTVIRVSAAYVLQVFIHISWLIKACYLSRIRGIETSVHQCVFPDNTHKSC